MRSLLTIATVSSKHSGKYRCSPSQVVFLKNIQHHLIIKQRNTHHQVTPDSVTVLVKSHADIGHSEPVTNLGSKQDGRGLLGLFFAIFAVTNLGGRQGGRGLVLLFFAIFAMTNLGSRQGRKA